MSREQQSGYTSFADRAFMDNLFWQTVDLWMQLNQFKIQLDSFLSRELSLIVQFDLSAVSNILVLIVLHLQFADFGKYDISCKNTLLDSENH